MGWKLVRDRNQEQFGGTVSGTWRKLRDSEIGGYLAQKLLEEAGEYVNSEDPLELFDMLDVLIALIMKPDNPDARKMHAMKVAVNGGFTEFWAWSPVPGDTQP
jgi:predicted house-cleaning noncanonical NTP pyrophosphatase (MazG superfamily)